MRRTSIYLAIYFITTFFLFGSLFATSVAPPLDLDSPTYWQFVGQRHDLLDKAVVQIISIDEEGKMTGRGTGFFIGPNLIATAAHVVDTPGTILKIRSYHEDVKSGLGRAEIRYIGEVHNKDVALLELTSRGDIYKLQESLEISTEYDAMQVVYSYGYGKYPMIADNFDVSGKAIGATGMIWEMPSDRTVGKFLHTADIFPGHSGGPLLNLEGKVIGINTSTHSGQELGTHKHRGFAQTKFVLSGTEPIQVLLDLINKGN